MKPLISLVTLTWLSAICVEAGLIVKAASPQITGNRATVKLTMANTFDESFSSARAAMFLLDENGKMLANRTQWVIWHCQSRFAQRGRARIRCNRQ
jgi:hypothetical protein